MDIKKMRSKADEIFKTIISFNPSFMKEILTTKINSRKRPSFIIIKYHATITYGDKSIDALGSKIWNSLSKKIEV